MHASSLWVSVFQAYLTIGQAASGPKPPAVRQLRGMCTAKHCYGPEEGHPCNQSSKEAVHDVGRSMPPLHASSQRASGAQATKFGHDSHRAFVSQWVHHRPRCNRVCCTCSVCTHTRLAISVIVLHALGSKVWPLTSRAYNIRSSQFILAIFWPFPGLVSVWSCVTCPQAVSYLELLVCLL